MSHKKFFQKILLKKLKKYTKWYTYPFIYFVVTSIAYLIAFHTKPISHREYIKNIFKTISLVPTIIWITIITIWILLNTLSSEILYLLKKKTSTSESFEALQEKDSFLNKKQKEKKINVDRNGWKKLLEITQYIIGLILIFTGLTLGIWIARPYITLLLSTSKINVLEKKAQTQIILDNRIIIPTILVDSPILEGVSDSNLKSGVCHLTGSPLPGEGGNTIIEGHNLAEFGLWKPRSFFSLLDIISEGTPVYIFYNGKKYIYKVKEKFFLNVKDPKLYDLSPGERLTLITCVSTWSFSIYSNKRTVVIAYPEF